MTAFERPEEIVRNYFYRSFTIVRAWMVIAVLLYTLFGVLDNYLIPVNKYQIWIVRYIFTVPAMVTTILATFFVRSNKVFEFFVVLFVVIAVIGLCAMIAIMLPTEKAFHLYFVGFFAIMTWTQIIGFGHHRFVMISVFIFISYNAVAVLFQKLHIHDIPEFIFINLFFATFFVFGFYASKIVERFLLADHRKGLESADDKIKLIASRNSLQEVDEFKSRLLSILSNDIVSAFADLKHVVSAADDSSKSEASTTLLAKIESLDLLTNSAVAWSNIIRTKEPEKTSVVDLYDVLRKAAACVVTIADVKRTHIVIEAGRQQQIFAVSDKLYLAIANLLSFLILMGESGRIMITLEEKGQSYVILLIHRADDVNEHRRQISHEKIKNTSLENAFAIKVAEAIVKPGGGTIQVNLDSLSFGFTITLNGLIR